MSKEHRKEYQNAWYQKNKAKRCRQSVESKRRQKEKLVNHFGGKCHICGGVFPPSVYDFHHTNPEEKEFNIAKICSLGYEKCLKEAKKCIMICANCHRILHAELHREKE